MSCEAIQQLIEQGDYDELPAPAREHLSSCALCQQFEQTQQQYIGLMRSLPALALAPSRSERMLRLAAAQAETKPSTIKFAQGFIAASVLAVAVVLGLSTPPASAPASDNLLASYDWTQEVTIAITVPQDMDDARLVLQMPASLDVEGYEYLAEVVWPLDLKQGSNTVVLPLVVDELVQFDESLTLPASLIYNGSQKDFELKLQLDTPQNPAHGQVDTGLAYKKLV